MAPIRVGDGNRSGSRRRRLRKRYSSELNGSCSDSENKGKIEKVMEDDDYHDIPLCLSSDEEEDGGYRKMTKAEIQMYNKQVLETGEAKYRFLRVVKLGSAMFDGYRHHITFEAKAKVLLLCASKLKFTQDSLSMT